MTRALWLIFVVGACNRREKEVAPVEVVKYAASTSARLTAVASVSPSATTSAVPIAGCEKAYPDFPDAMRAKDYACVRAMLLPAFASYAIRAPEVLYLHAACAALGDTACERLSATKM